MLDQYRFIDQSALDNSTLSNNNTMPSQEQQDGKDAAILQELREISNRHSPYNNNNSNNASSNKRPRLGAAASSEKDSVKSQNSNTFLTSTDENGNLNQYWYSKNTIDTLCNAIREGLSIGGDSESSSRSGSNSSRRVAFLSTPSLFFSLSSQEREHCALFDVSFKLIAASYSHV